DRPDRIHRPLVAEARPESADDERTVGSDGGKIDAIAEGGGGDQSDYSWAVRGEPAFRLVRCCAASRDHRARHRNAERRMQKAELRSTPKHEARLGPGLPEWDRLSSLSSGRAQAGKPALHQFCILNSAFYIPGRCTNDPAGRR